MSWFGRWVVDQEKESMLQTWVLIIYNLTWVFTLALLMEPSPSPTLEFPNVIVFAFPFETGSQGHNNLDFARQSRKTYTSLPPASAAQGLGIMACTTIHRPCHAPLFYRALSELTFHHCLGWCILCSVSILVYGVPNRLQGMLFNGRKGWLL